MNITLRRAKMITTLSAVLMFATPCSAQQNPEPIPLEAQVKKLQTELDESRKDRDRWKAVATNTLPGALVHLTEAIVPPIPINMKEVLPEPTQGLGERLRGVIVVNCWVDATGKVKEVRMMQPFPGRSYGVKEVNEVYLDAAKRLKFSPASNADGKIRYQAWVPVGFFIDE